MRACKIHPDYFEAIVCALVQSTSCLILVMNIKHAPCINQSSQNILITLLGICLVSRLPEIFLTLLGCCHYSACLVLIYMMSGAGLLDVSAWIDALMCRLPSLHM